MEKELPKNWIETELDSLFSLAYGKGLSVKELLPEGEYNVYGANGIIGKYNDFNQEKSKVIISCRGAASGAIHKTIPKSFVTSNSIVLDAYSDELLLPDYVKYFMTSVDKTEVITGTAQPQITIQLLKNLNFCFPPIAEQQRIVSKLDELFRHLDTLKTCLNNIPQLLKKFRQAVLSQAVTGKLTEEWRVGKDLEKSSLLNENNFIEFELINYEVLPKNWLKTALGNYTNCSRGKFSARPRNDPKYFNGIFPFMQIGDLPREGGYTSTFSKTLNDEGVKVSKSFPKGTVVIAIVGATIGITGILEKEMFFPDSLIGMNCERFISNQFLEFYLRLCKDGFREISYAGGGQPNIKLPTIKNLELLIPPIEEQTEIVNRVERLFTKVDTIEAQYENLKTKIDSLPQAILAKAFKGELVEQLDTDGDAKVLLEEIQKMKASLKPAKKTVRARKKKA